MKHSLRHLHYLQRYSLLKSLQAGMLAVTTLLLISCANTDQQAISADGLTGVNSPMNELYIRDGSDFGQYRQFYFEPLTVAYSKQKHNDNLNRREADFQFDNNELAIFEQKFQAGFSQQWQQQLNWSQAEQPSAGVLIVRAAVSDLYLYASIKNDSRSPDVALANETSKMQLQIELVDAANQHVLLRMRDQKTTGQFNSGTQSMMPVTSVSYWHDAQRMFRQTANSLSRYLGTE